MTPTVKSNFISQTCTCYRQRGSGEDLIIYRRLYFILKLPKDIYKKSKKNCFVFVDLFKPFTVLGCGLWNKLNKNGISKENVVMQ